MSAESKVKVFGMIVGPLVVVVVVVYAMSSGRGTEVTMPGGFSVKLTEKALSPEGTGQTEAAGVVEGLSPTASGFLVDIPGRSPLPLASIDVVYGETLSDDPQRIHAALVVDMLNSGDLQRLFKESDDVGMFSSWITAGAIRDGRRCLSYNTLYERWSGTTEIGFRLACPSEDGWNWEISPDLLELMQSSGG